MECQEEQCLGNSVPEEEVKGRCRNKGTGTAGSFSFSEGTGQVLFRWRMALEVDIRWLSRQSSRTPAAAKSNFAGKRRRDMTSTVP